MCILSNYHKVCEMNSSQFPSFMLQFLTEKDLNAYIAITRDLPSLEFALQLKLEYISNDTQGRMSFSMIPIINEANQDNIESVCRTLEYALRVQIDELQSKQLLSEISTKLYSNTKDINIEELTFLNVVLKFCVEEQKSALVLEVINETLIVRLLNDESKVINDYVTVKILPLLFKICPENSINKIVCESIYAKKMSSMLCGIIDYLLPETDKAWSIVYSEKFWQFVHDCFNCKEICHEREGLFLLKRAISSIEHRDKFSVNYAIASWSRNSKARVLESLKAYLTLRDVCREKQLHLIEPAYPLLQKIETLDPVWVLALYRTLLLHPHNAVSLQAVRNILTSNWASLGIVFKDVINVMLPAINRNQHLTDIYCHMDYFLNTIGTENYFLLLRESFKIIWIPIACYQFYKHMLIRKVPDKISCDIFKNLIRIMNKVPHKYVRDGCLTVAVEFAQLNFFCPSQIQFDNCLQIAHSLHKVVPKSTYIKHLTSFPKNIKDLVVMMFDTCPNSNIRQAEMNVKYIDVIVESLEELTRSEKMEEKWLEENVLRPHLNRVLDTETLDKLVIVLCVNNKFELAFPYLETRIKTNSAIECNISEILNTTFRFIEERPEFSYIFEFIISFIQQCVCVLVDESGEFPMMQKLFAFEALIAAVNKQFVYLELKDQIAGVINFWMPKMRNSYSGRIDDDLYFLACNLYCLYKTRECERLDELTAMEMCILFEHIFNSKNDSVIPKLYALLPVVTTKIANSSTSILGHTLDLFCNNLCILQKTKAFPKSLASLCACILSVTFAVDYCKLLEKILLVCKSDEAFYVVTRELFNAKCAVPCVTQLLLHGDVLVKEQRAEYEVYQVIHGTNQSLISASPYFYRAQVRFLIAQLIVAEQAPDRWKNTVLGLIVMYQKDFKKRYFANSQLHLNKLRILQAFSILDKQIQDKDQQMIIGLLMESLCSESHQMSVKFFLQWLLIRLLCDKEESLKIIVSKVAATDKAQPSTIIAFIPILYHLALHRNTPEFWNSVLELMLSWTMGPHFNLRLHSQEGVMRLSIQATRAGHGGVVSKYQSALSAVKTSLQNTERSLSMVDNFFYDSFDPISDFDLTIVYAIIPRITQVTEDEYKYIEFDWRKNGKYLKFKLLDDSLQIKSEEVPITMASSSPTQSHIIQKKIMTWKDSCYNSEAWPSTNSELIVVASLLDKAPNLGGLSRTCEVFGVKQLVVNSRSVTNDVEFKSLSMSSEKWVNFEEAKRNNLHEYLLKRKGEGFHIVGAEQTSDSVMLNSYQFPKKTLLLLGNEKDGIPPNFLSLIDTCVEIPQYGVVRSLNVHVAASTFIWEYAKQHIIPR